MVRAALLVLACLVPLAEARDRRVQPGARFVVEDRGSGLALHGGHMRMEISIPRDYRRGIAVPLIVWFGEGRGSHSTERVRSIVGPDTYVCVALSYRLSQLRAGWQTPWPCFQRMIDEAGRIVGNIDPDRRAAMGWQEGGRAITWAIAHSGGLFQESFAALAVGGAGSPKGDLKSIRRHPLLVFGELEDQRFVGLARLDQEAKAAGLNSTLLAFKRDGPAIPDRDLSAIRLWLNEHVASTAEDDAHRLLRKALRREDWSDALTHLRYLLKVLPRENPMRRRAESVLPEISEAGDEEFEKLLTLRVTETALQEFVNKWRPAPCIRRAIRLGNPHAERKLAKLLVQAPSERRAKLQEFLRKWHRFPVYETALAAFEADAGAEFARLKRIEDPDERIAALKDFDERWWPASVAREARLTRGLEAFDALDLIRIEPDPERRERALTRFARRHPTTGAAAEARRMLGH